MEGILSSQWKCARIPSAKQAAPFPYIQMISQSWRCLECTRAQALRDVGWSPMALSSGSLWQEIPKSCDSVAQPDHKPRLCTGTGCPGKHFAHYTGRWRRANRAECQHAAWAHITGTAHTAGTAAPSQPFHCQQVLQLHALSQRGHRLHPLQVLTIRSSTICCVVQLSVVHLQHPSFSLQIPASLPVMLPAPTPAQRSPRTDNHPDKHGPTEERCPNFQPLWMRTFPFCGKLNFKV